MNLNTPTAATVDVAQVVLQSRGYWTTVWQRLKRDKVTVAFAVLLAAIILSAIFAPLIAPHDPYKGNILRRLKEIGYPGHLLGTDETGRDMLTRLIYGGRLSLFMGVMPVVNALVDRRTARRHCRLRRRPHQHARSCAPWTSSTLSRPCCSPSPSRARWVPASATRSCRSPSCSFRRSRALPKASRPRCAPSTMWRRRGPRAYRRRASFACMCSRNVLGTDLHLRDGTGERVDHPGVRPVVPRPRHAAAGSRMGPHAEHAAAGDLREPVRRGFAWRDDLSDVAQLQPAVAMGCGRPWT